TSRCELIRAGETPATLPDARGRTGPRRDAWRAAGAATWSATCCMTEGLVWSWSAVETGRAADVGELSPAGGALARASVGPVVPGPTGARITVRAATPESHVSEVRTPHRFNTVENCSGSSWKTVGRGADSRKLAL